MNLKYLLFTIALTTNLPAQHPRKPSPPTPIGPTAPQKDQNPVGHWVAKGNPNNDIQLWWDFHADHTLTLTAGATAHSIFKLQDNVLTLGIGTPKVPAGVFDIKFANGKLYTTPRADKPPTLEYTRIGVQKYTSAPLIGKWQITDAPHADDPQQEAIRNRLVRTITAYNSDGTYEVRVPIDITEGTWNEQTHTVTLKNYDPLPYLRIGTSLMLSSPIGDKARHAYIPDSFY